MNILRRLLGVMMLGSAIWLATLLLPHFGFVGQSTGKERELATAKRASY